MSKIDKKQLITAARKGYFGDLRGDISSLHLQVLEGFMNKDVKYHMDDSWQAVVKFTVQLLNEDDISGKPTIFCFTCSLPDKFDEGRFKRWSNGRPIEEICAYAAYFRLVSPSDFKIALINLHEGTTLQDKNNSAAFSSFHVFHTYYLALVRQPFQLSDEIKKELGLNTESIKSVPALLMSSAIKQIDLRTGLVVMMDSTKSQAGHKNLIQALTALINAPDDIDPTQDELLKTLRLQQILSYCAQYDFPGNSFALLLRGRNAFDWFVQQSKTIARSFFNFTEDVFDIGIETTKNTFDHLIHSNEMRVFNKKDKQEKLKRAELDVE
jgi:hypothetical protein